MQNSRRRVLSGGVNGHIVLLTYTHILVISLGAAHWTLAYLYYSRVTNVRHAQE